MLQLSLFWYPVNLYCVSILLLISVTSFSNTIYCILSYLSVIRITIKNNIRSSLFILTLQSIKQTQTVLFVWHPAFYYFQTVQEESWDCIATAWIIKLKQCEYTFQSFKYSFTSFFVSRTAFQISSMYISLRIVWKYIHCILENRF